MIIKIKDLPVSTLCCGVERPRRLLLDVECPPFANIDAIKSHASRNTFFDAIALCCSSSIIIPAIAENSSDDGNRRSIRSKSVDSFELISTAAHDGKISVRGGTISFPLPLLSANLHLVIIDS